MKVGISTMVYGVISSGDERWFATRAARDREAERVGRSGARLRRVDAKLADLDQSAVIASEPARVSA